VLHGVPVCCAMQRADQLHGKRFGFARHRARLSALAVWPQDEVAGP
jgi:hypothetical protein